MKTTRTITVLAVAALALTVTACELHPEPPATYDQIPTSPAYPAVIDNTDKSEFTQIRYSHSLSEIRFTTSEGIKMRCFLYGSANSAGLDGCERVG